MAKVNVTMEPKKKSKKGLIVGAVAVVGGAGLLIRHLCKGKGRDEGDEDYDEEDDEDDDDCEDDEE